MTLCCCAPAERGARETVDACLCAPGYLSPRRCSALRDAVVYVAAAASTTPGRAAPVPTHARRCRPARCSLTSTVPYLLRRAHSSPAAGRRSALACRSGNVVPSAKARLRLIVAALGWRATAGGSACCSPGCSTCPASRGLARLEVGDRAVAMASPSARRHALAPRGFAVLTGCRRLSPSLVQRPRIDNWRAASPSHNPHAPGGPALQVPERRLLRRIALACRSSPLADDSALFRGSLALRECSVMPLQRHDNLIHAPSPCCASSPPPADPAGTAKHFASARCQFRQPRSLSLPGCRILGSSAVPAC